MSKLQANFALEIEHHHHNYHNHHNITIISRARHLQEPQRRPSLTWTADVGVVMTTLYSTDRYDNNSIVIDILHRLVSYRYTGTREFTC
jgi:hypothetical protein